MMEWSFAKAVVTLMMFFVICQMVYQHLIAWTMWISLPPLWFASLWKRTKSPMSRFLFERWIELHGGLCYGWITICSVVVYWMKCGTLWKLKFGHLFFLCIRLLSWITVYLSEVKKFTWNFTLLPFANEKNSKNNIIM